MTANLKGKLKFDFDFEGKSRADLLQEASDVFTAGLLGGEAEKTRDAAQREGISLLEKLNQQVAQFGRVTPEHLELKEQHFSKHGLPVPLRFKDLSKSNRIFWVRLPITLKKSSDLGFKRLMCSVEFNPNELDPDRIPRSLMLLPHSKFQDLIDTTAEVKLIIGENFDFEAQMPETTQQAGPANLQFGAGVDIEQAAKMGFIAGPFGYKLRKAKIEHSSVGTEEAHWTITGEEFFQEDDPMLVVVLQVPRSVPSIELRAAMQAYSTIRFDDSVLKYMRSKVVEFFTKGAPIPDEAVWSIDLTR